MDKHAVHHHINNHMLLEAWAQSILSDDHITDDKPPQSVKKHIKQLTVDCQDRRKAG